MGIILARVGLVRVWGSNQAATGKMFSLCVGGAFPLAKRLTLPAIGIGRDAWGQEGCGDRDREDREDDGE